MNSYKILILTHGNAGKELLASSEMIVGKTIDTAYVSLMPGMPHETFVNEIRGKLSASNETLVLTDLYGGTPSNTALLLSRDFKLKCISGVNLAMVIEANILKESVEELTFEQFVARIYEAGTEACQSYELKGAQS